jgi:endonuclease/exonuclease/phosphatase (EEP) superfamily protein YafD
VKRGLAAAVGLLAAVSLLGLLDRYSWLFEILTLPRLQYVALGAGLAAAALVLRAWRTLAVAVVVAGLNFGLVSSSWRAAPGHGPVVPGARLHAVVLNVLYANDDTTAVLGYLHRVAPDVVGVTELTPRWAEALRTAGWRPAAAAPAPGAYGIGLFARRPVRARIEHFPADGPPSVVASLLVGGRRVTFVVTHPHTPFGPTAGGLHRRQLRALADAVPRLGRRVAICGDLNTTPWSTPFQWLLDAGLRDSHRGRGYDPSFPAGARMLGLPIDDCLVSRGLAVLERRTGPEVGSDHLPLEVELAVTRLPR